MRASVSEDKYQVIMLFAIQGIEKDLDTASVLFRGGEIKIDISSPHQIPGSAFRVVNAEVVRISTELVFSTREDALDFVDFFSGEMACRLVREEVNPEWPAAQLIFIEISMNGLPSPVADFHVYTNSPGPRRLTDLIGSENRGLKPESYETAAIWEASYYYNRSFFAAHWSVRITDLVNALEALAGRVSRANDELEIVRQLESVVIESDLNAEAKSRLRNAVSQMKNESVRQSVIRMVLEAKIIFRRTEADTRSLLHLAYNKRSDFAHGRMRHWAESEDYRLIHQLREILRALIVRRRIIDGAIPSDEH